MKTILLIAVVLFIGLASVLAGEFKRFEITYYLPSLVGAQRITVTAEGGYAAVKIVEGMFPGARVSSSYREVRLLFF